MPENLRNLIDIEEIAVSIGMGSIDQRYFLDRETGEIIWLPGEDVVELEEDRARIESDTTNRYLILPFVESFEGYRHMDDFIETVQDGKLKEFLYIAINGQGAFRRFKDVLLGYPEERERWFKFENQRNLERAREWLDTLK